MFMSFEKNGIHNKTTHCENEDTSQNYFNVTFTFKGKQLMMWYFIQINYKMEDSNEYLPNALFKRSL